MIPDLLLILVGGVLLYFGAEWLVGGASGLAASFGIRPLVVGLTVVAFGTSAPELVVSLVAALEGHSAIALGNVVGSNIANIGLILGVTALISPPKVDGSLIWREVPVFVAAAALLPFCLWDGELSRLEGMLLISGGVLFTWVLLRAAKQVPAQAPESREMTEEVTAEAAHGSRWKLSGLTILGLGGLVLGGKLFVDGASSLALALGMSERVVGLTIVAVGTSLPELATSVIAAMRGHSSIAVGNVVGSNIYNVLLILGATAAASPIAATFKDNQVDLAVLLAISFAAAVLLRTERYVRRVEGGLLLVAYGAFLGVLALGG